MRRLGASFVLVCIAGLTLGVSAATAEQITAFKIKPTTVSSAGGELEISATVPLRVEGEEPQCTISVTPSYGGLPPSFGCFEAKWPYVVVPPNTTTGTLTYGYTVTATYSQGPALTSKAVKVKSAPAPASTYVALGDSYSSGEGNPAKSPKSWVDRAGKGSEIENGCDRSTVAYPMLVGKWLAKQRSLPSMSLRFLACSGATTEDIWSSGAHSRYGLEEGNHIEWQQLLDTADLAKARIVTVTTGGDDLNFSDILKNCTVSLTDTCGSSSEDGWIADLEQNIGTLEPILRETYLEIANEAPGAALYVVGYPDLLPAQATPTDLEECSDRTLIEPEGIEYLIDAQSSLMHVVAQAAREAGAHFVNPNFTGAGGFAGHAVCGQSSSWFNALNVVDPQYSYHPNKAGQAALSTDVEAAIAADSSPTGGPLQGAGAVATGQLHACAPLIAGGVDCWGENNVGELGDGSWGGPETCPVNVPCSLRPVAVDGLTNATQVASGSSFTCALLTSKQVECWGDDVLGELGTASFGSSPAPVPVSGLSDVTQISAGADHACALLASGSVECWGDNVYGELGDGTSTGPESCDSGGSYCSDAPVPVHGITDATQIAAGDEDTCAVLAGGSAECWGGNEEGELGNDSTTSSDVPVKVHDIGDATAISTNGSGGGIDDVCALLAGGTVECWGDNRDGELGDGSNTGPESCGGETACSLVPVAVEKIASAIQVSVGGQFVCATLADGSVDCWGEGGSGQLGDGIDEEALEPVEVNDIYTARQVSSGDLSACAALADGEIECWGANFYGELGDGTTTEANRPTFVH